MRDISAAEATRDSVAGLFLVELTTLPLTSSSGGFVYRMNPALGVVERASDSFGPFYTERALRSGKGQVSFALIWESSKRSSLQGADLSDGTFPTNSSRVAGAVDPFTVDTLALELDTRRVTATAGYGLSDQFDIGIAVPFVSLQFSAQRVSTFTGLAPTVLSGSGSASGLGDITVTARYKLNEARHGGIALGSDLQLPTGRQEDLLGTADPAVALRLIGSLERGRFAAHGNAGIAAGGASSALFWEGAATFVAHPRVTVVGELIGRHLSELHRLRDVYQPHPVLAGIETMRWLPQDGGVHTSYAVTGVKWNIGGSVLVNASLLTRLTDAGLTGRVIPSVSIDYAVGR